MDNFEKCYSSCQGSYSKKDKPVKGISRCKHNMKISNWEILIKESGTYYVAMVTKPFDCKYSIGIATVVSLECSMPKSFAKENNLLRAVL